ncbi:MAG: hypothetical protein WCQ48_02070 [Chloroflexota bacterium]
MPNTPSPVLDLAIRLWPQVRDRGAVDDPSDLDMLLAAQGQPGAPGLEGGVSHTFACFAPDEAATFALSTGEQPRDDADARLIAHILVTRTLLGAGLSIDRRVQAAMGDAYAMTWGVSGGYEASPLALATSMWLAALDPQQASDRPLPIDWSPTYYQDGERWNLDYRLFSHYDIRERMLDWVSFASVAPSRHPGCSVWTLVEPLTRIPDQRAHMALAQFGEASDEAEDAIPAAAMLERARIAALLRAYVAQMPRG